MSETLDDGAGTVIPLRPGKTEGPGQTQEPYETGPRPLARTDETARRAGQDPDGTTTADDGEVPVLQGTIVSDGVPRYFQDVEHPPLLPVWLSDRDHLKAAAKWAVNYYSRKSLFHGLRLPKYSARLAVYAPRGGYRTVRLWGRWAFDTEGAPLRRKAVESNEYPAYKWLSEQRNERVRARLWISGALGLAAAAGVGLAAAAVGAPVFAAGALAALGWAGRPEESRSILDAQEMPLRLEFKAEHLNAAFRAAGMLPSRGAEDPPELVLWSDPYRHGNGWAAVFDLPRGVGKTANDALAKRDVIAAELGVDEIQLIMSRIRASSGGHAARLSIWVADDDPYIGTPTASPLEQADSFSVWTPIPLGADAQGSRVEISLMWQSMFFGGLPRRGKTFSQRIPSAAGVLDPHVRHYVADGKGGNDWTPMRLVAHRLVLGAEDEALPAFIAMLDELIAEMFRRFAWFRTHPQLAPDGKLTPEISRRHGLPVIFVTIDELQEYLAALSDKEREVVIGKLCRLARRGPAAGFISNFASQRPDADSVPTKLREIISYRYCTQVIDRTSSDMVLGKGKAAQGADASVLSEDHVGVGVLVTGPANFVTLRFDKMDIPAFKTVCERGRALREKAGTLSGDAADDPRAAAGESFEIPSIVGDVLDVMHNVTRMHTENVLAGLRNLDEDTYGDHDADRLARELEAAGVRRTTRQVKIDGRNANGWLKSDIEGVIPPDVLAT